jgi:hypothetical protein
MPVYSNPGQLTMILPICSEHTPQGLKKTVLGQTLLNGNNITMVCTILHIWLYASDKYYYSSFPEVKAQKVQK